MHVSRNKQGRKPGKKKGASFRRRFMLKTRCLGWELNGF